MRWIASGEKGIRYREHPTRIHRGQPDRYYSVRLTRDGRDVEESLGWASDGWTLRKAQDTRENLQTAYKIGSGPDTLRKRRDERARQEEQASTKAKAEQAKAATYQELVEEYYEPWAKREKKSFAADLTRLRLHLYPALGPLPLDAITSERVEALRDNLLESHSRATCVQCLALLRKTFNHLARAGLHNLRNPVSSVKLPRLDNEVERFFTHEEFDRFIEAASKLRNPDLHDAALLSLHTGLRLGEIKRLFTWDIDLEHGFVTVREDDGKPGGKVPLNNDVSEMLKNRLRDIQAGPVFHNRGYEDRELSRRFMRLARRLGLNTGKEDRRHRLTFHSLRHTFASWMALADIELYRIQKLMRHKTPQMTQRYAHLRPSELRGDVAVLCRPPASPPDCETE